MIDYILLEQYANNKSVLFVEDDENIRKETKELLEEIFTYVEIANDGSEGLEKYINYKNNNNKNFDIVITDIKMPLMDGIELTKEIYKENKNQIIIVLSAHSESKYLLELVNIGISQFITKPLEYERFLQVIFTQLAELSANDLPHNKINSTYVEINEVLSWDRKTKTLYNKHEIIKLTKKEILFLNLLLQENESIHTVDKIINILWEIDTSKADITNLKNVISRLRKKVPSLDIENVYGLGYRINLK